MIRESLEAPHSPSRRPYRRVDLSAMQPALDVAAAPGTPEGEQAVSGPVRWWCVLPLSLLLCGVISTVTVLAANMPGNTLLGTTLIPVTAFGILALIGGLINPALRLAIGRRASLSRREVMCIFGALLVTSGIPGYGLAHQFVPILPAAYNPDWNTTQRGWEQELHPNLKTSLFIADSEVCRAFYNGIQPTGEGDAFLGLAPDATIGEKVSYWWRVAGQIAWGHWLPPLLGWAVFVGAGYGLFYSLAYLLLPTWNAREKLIFPLAKIPEALLPDDRSSSRSGLPALMRDHGFWFSLAAVFLLLSYNAMVTADMLPALNKVSLGMSNWQIAQLLKGTFLAGVWPSWQMPRLMFLFIFTAIGISFLLPTETSFSLWGHYLAGLGVIILLIGMGQGQGMNDFPSNWIWENNPVSAIGAGGMLMFSAYILYKAVKDYFKYQRRGTTWLSLKLGVPALGAIVSTLVIWAWLMWVGLPLFWAGVFVFGIVLIVVGLMRVAAESGIYWTQVHGSFFHVFHHFGLGRWLNPVNLAPVLPAYWILYLDVKAFAGSNLINAAKLEDDTAGRIANEAGETDSVAGPKAQSRRSDRLVFHLNMVACIALAAVLSVGLLIVMSHVKGGYQMNRWFFTAAPPALMDHAVQIATHQPAVQWNNASWYVIGALYLVLVIRLRKSLFWWPHPIGFVMLCNPLIGHIWLSIFVGWCCKKVVVTYGGKATFDRARGIFLGMIVGELLAILVWTALSMSTDITHGLTLNRYNP